MPTLSLDGAEAVQLFYESRGTGEPVLLLHGQGSSTQDWLHQRVVLESRYRVVAFDLRGHGLSSVPAAGYDIPGLARDAARVIRALDLGPTHIIGHSLGGVLAIQLALEEPGLVRTLAVLNAHARFTRRTPFEALAFAAQGAIQRLCSMRTIGRIAAKSYLPGPEHEATRAALIERFSKNDKRVFRTIQKEVMRFDALDRVGRITCPLLVVHSEHDILSLRGKRELTGAVAGARLEVIPSSRHLVILDQPDLLNEILLAFLSEASASDRSRA